MMNRIGLCTGREGMADSEARDFHSSHAELAKHLACKRECNRGKTAAARSDPFDFAQGKLFRTESSGYLFRPMVFE
jgi:hypothetical protein